MQISHYDTSHLLREGHFRYVKCLFTNLQKQYNTLKVAYLSKIQTLRVSNLRVLRIKNVKISAFCLYEREQIGTFSNLH